jgi:predicted RNA binding protein YcfA (HicA-like mRNA interferase family)
MQYMTSKQVVKLLRAHGWEKKAQKGSHLQMHHARRKGKVTIPMHGGDIPPGTLQSIFKQAGLR